MYISAGNGYFLKNVDFFPFWDFFSKIDRKDKQLETNDNMQWKPIKNIFKKWLFSHQKKCNFRKKCINDSEIENWPLFFKTKCGQACRFEFHMQIKTWNFWKAKKNLKIGKKNENFEEKSIFLLKIYRIKFKSEIEPFDKPV